MSIVCAVKMARSFIILICAVVCVANGMNTSLDKEWKMYKRYFKKQYTGNEESKRRAIWEDSVKFVFRHNVEADMGEHSYTTGVNIYSDMDFEEFLANATGFRPKRQEKKSEGPCPKAFHLPPDTKVKRSVDWFKLGYVTPAKYQGQCGACWAFCSTGAFEALTKRKTGKLLPLSEQNLIDCVGGGSRGCSGGGLVLAFNYIVENGGIDTEASYPFEEKDGKCRFNTSTIGVTCDVYGESAMYDEREMKRIVGTVGPISVGMNADAPPFQFYRGGLFSYGPCNTRSLDHCVLITGYGTEDGKKYWLVKNSWGESWGTKGFFKILRNTNECGIAADNALYPIS